MARPRMEWNDKIRDSAFLGGLLFSTLRLGYFFFGNVFLLVNLLSRFLFCISLTFDFGLICMGPWWIGMLLFYIVTLFHFG